jgi:hypothetical protein
MKSKEKSSDFSRHAVLLAGLWGWIGSEPLKHGQAVS